MTKFADDAKTELAKKLLAEERKASDFSRSEFNRLAVGRPTPTQEENDLAMLGAHILEHDDDGSGPETHTRHMEATTHPAQRPAAYQTRAARGGASGASE